MARGLTERELRAKCAELHLSLRHPTKPLASEEEVKAAQPGGADNPRRGFAGWVECYALLKSYLRRIELQADRRADVDARLEALVRDAAAKKPISVALSIGTRHVHQKSAWALHYLESLDAMVSPLARWAEWIGQQEDAALEALRAYPALLQGTAWRVWAWILLHEGVGLPFADTDAVEPPAWTQDLLVEDHIAIFAAHVQLHRDAVLEMAMAMRDGAQAEQSRLSLSGFVAGYGHEHGIRPSEMLRSWGYPESIAAALSAFEAHRVAEANAKAKSDAKRGARA